MAYRFLLAIHNDDGTIPMAGTNDRIPLQGIKTLSGACRRISKYKLNRGKDFSIIDVTDDTVISFLLL